ncbi:MAG: asparagine synthase (glutamine-hydrolyzing) [Planctomycetes bacterium]|nr:asparagine synthase (glutamine-hydrolyzing) [Planctomycetota bacterium]
MCGIAGILDFSSDRIPDLDRRLAVMNQLIQHRGPDGDGVWVHRQGHAGFAHRRLSIIDIEHGSQPMSDEAGNWITFNGEIYNYIELRQEIGEERFTTDSDTEVILGAYRKWGRASVDHLRGMFAFAIWDERNQSLFCARDRFGIKPFYYSLIGNAFYFASEVKAFMPFLDRIETDLEGFKDYLAFQFCLAGKTLFQDVVELLPGHLLEVRNGQLRVSRYWEVFYNLDFDHTDQYFMEAVSEHIEDSVRLHLRADVPVGAYLSGGLDSSIVSAVASQRDPAGFMGFTGKFTYGPEYDESRYARDLAESSGFPLREVDITVDDFINHISTIIYHLDYPVAGPGSFPQYMVSQLASQHRKVVLGGQGGDEIFGGYTRYLIAYFEQCIKAAIDGTSNNGNFVVTYESIIPNLTSMRNYKPLLKQFWAEGLFEDLDRRYFRLIDRAPQLGNEIRWDALGDYNPFDSFSQIFHSGNVQKESYFDLMTHFDFKTLLPALLHVEDRVSMAHGLESRVPLLDHPLVELAATIPANIKFRAGSLKRVLRESMAPRLPKSIVERKDKMGFPVPLTEWMQGEARDFIHDIFDSQAARQRDLIDNRIVLEGLHGETKFGRKYWGLLSLELWQRAFHDKAHAYRQLMEHEEIVV